jgi:peptidyl-tRNA hydrolase, PTH1 family
MNLSGDAVRKVVDFYKLQPESQLLVIVDDIDLSCGDLRFKVSGGPGTHNGMKSIVQTLGEKFPRLRIGLGAPPAGSDLATWVLSTHSPEEDALLRKALEQVPERVSAFITGVLTPNR